MSGDKKTNLFAKLAAQNSRPDQGAAIPEPVVPDAATAESPTLQTPPADAIKAKSATARKKPEPIIGKRGNPEYCQANAYVPKSVRRSVDRALIDIEGLDYSTLITDLLRKWLKSRGNAE